MSVFGANRNGDTPVRQAGAPPPHPASSARPAETARAGAEASIINSGVKVVGNMESDGDIMVAGAVEGDIASVGLTVGEGAMVKGTIAAGTATILGRVEGEIRTRTIRVAATGEIVGDIAYESLAVDSGARIDGRVRKADPEARAAAANAGKAAPAAAEGGKAAAPAGGSGGGGSGGAAKPAPQAAARKP